MTLIHSPDIPDTGDVSYINLLHLTNDLVNNNQLYIKLYNFLTNTINQNGSHISVFTEELLAAVKLKLESTQLVISYPGAANVIRSAFDILIALTGTVGAVADLSDDDWALLTDKLVRAYLRGYNAPAQVKIALTAANTYPWATTILLLESLCSITEIK